MTDEPKPKSCPFCGAEATVSPFTAASITSYLIQCDCGAEVSMFETRDGLLDCWNSRPIEDALRARISELEAHNAGAAKIINSLTEGWAALESPDGRIPK